jgi:hypothetical protein
MIPTSVLCIEHVPSYAYGGLHEDIIQIELVPIIYVLENAGVGLGDHALIPSSEVVLGAGSCLERRASGGEAMQLCSCELPALI